MKCYIQRRLSGVFSGSLPLMNKAHLYIFCRWFGFCFFSGKFPRDRPQFIVILIRPTRGRGARARQFPNFAFEQINAMPNHTEMTKFSCVFSVWPGALMKDDVRQKYFNGTRKFAMARSSLHCKLKGVLFWSNSQK